MLRLVREYLGGTPAAAKQNSEPAHAQIKKSPGCNKAAGASIKLMTKMNRYTPGMVQMSFFIIFHWPVLLSY